VDLIEQEVLEISLKSGLMTYGGGQLARGIGGVGNLQRYIFSNGAMGRIIAYLVILFNDTEWVRLKFLVNEKAPGKIGGEFKIFNRSSRY
jgi:hypothetical protein